MTRFNRHAEFSFAHGATVPYFFALAKGVFLFRPWSPKGKTGSGLWLERNPNHPKIWGWIVGVPHETLVERPSFVPGAQVVITRHQGEPFDDVYIHHAGTHPLVAMPVDAVSLAIFPPLIEMREKHVETFY